MHLLLMTRLGWVGAESYLSCSRLLYQGKEINSVLYSTNNIEHHEEALHANLTTSPHCPWLFRFIACHYHLLCTNSLQNVIPQHTCNSTMLFSVVSEFQDVQFWCVYLIVALYHFWQHCFSQPFLQSSSSVLLSHTLNSHSCIINHVTQQEDIQYCIIQCHAAIKENASSLFVQIEIIICKTGNFSRIGYQWVVMIFSTLPPFSHWYVCRD